MLPSAERHFVMVLIIVASLWDHDLRQRSRVFSSSLTWHGPLPSEFCSWTWKNWKPHSAEDGPLLGQHVVCIKYYMYWVLMSTVLVARTEIDTHIKWQLLHSERFVCCLLLMFDVCCLFFAFAGVFAWVSNYCIMSKLNVCLSTVVGFCCLSTLYNSVIGGYCLPCLGFSISKLLCRRCLHLIVVYLKLKYNLVRGMISLVWQPLIGF